MSSENVGDDSWGIYEFPIDYSKSEYCHSRHLGRKPLFNFDSKIGKISLAKVVKEEEADEATTSESATSLPEEQKAKPEVAEVAPAASFYNRFYEFSVEDEIELFGPKSIWGRSLVLEGPARDRICATIEPEVDESALKVAEAR